ADHQAPAALRFGGLRLTTNTRRPAAGMAPADSIPTNPSPADPREDPLVEHPRPPRQRASPPPGPSRNARLPHHDGPRRSPVPPPGSFQAPPLGSPPSTTRQRRHIPAPDPFQTPRLEAPRPRQRRSAFPE